MTKLQKLFADASRVDRALGVAIAMLSIARIVNNLRSQPTG